jgi:hypothetical protein
MTHATTPTANGSVLDRIVFVVAVVVVHRRVASASSVASSSWPSRRLCSVGCGAIGGFWHCSDWCSTQSSLYNVYFNWVVYYISSASVCVCVEALCACM